VERVVLNALAEYPRNLSGLMFTPSAIAFGIGFRHGESSIGEADPPLQTEAEINEKAARVSPACFEFCG
jgi:hypothetical protein